MAETAHDTSRAARLERASDNFALAKVGALLLVVSGHFLPGAWLWPAVAVGLFVLAFASGYFTSVKYDAHCPLGPFWKRKLVRLGPGLLAADLLLLLLFLIQDKPGVWSWQTPINMLGLTGILNWFGIPNASPFGHGLWFLTLLLLFYAVYPLLRSAARRRTVLWLTAGTTLVAAAVLHFVVPMGHMLWLTAWAFVFGVFSERAALSASPWASGCVGVLLGGLMIGLNVVFGLNQLNFVLLIAVAVSAVLFLMAAPIPRFLVAASRPIAGCMLEIYVLHTYLFLRPTGYVAVNLLITLAVILAVSWPLAHLARLATRVLVRETAGGQPAARAVRSRPSPGGAEGIVQSK